MNSENYVAREWERRFQIHQKKPAGERFAIGFALGAILTGVVFFWFESAISGQIAL